MQYRSIPVSQYRSIAVNALYRGITVYLYRSIAVSLYRIAVSLYRRPLGPLGNLSYQQIALGQQSWIADRSTWEQIEGIWQLLIVIVTCFHMVAHMVAADLSCYNLIFTCNQQR